MRKHAAGSLAMRRAGRQRPSCASMRICARTASASLSQAMPSGAGGLKTLIVSCAVTIWQRSKSWLSTAMSSGGRSASTMVATGPAGSQELPQDRVLQTGIAMAFAPSRRPPWIIAIEPISPRPIRGGSCSATAASHSPPPPLGPRLLPRSAPSGSSPNSRLCKASLRREAGMPTVEPRSRTTSAAQRWKASRLSLIAFTPRKSECWNRRSAASFAPKHAAFFLGEGAPAVPRAQALSLQGASQSSRARAGGAWLFVSTLASSH